MFQSVRSIVLFEPRMWVIRHMAVEVLDRKRLRTKVIGGIDFEGAVIHPPALHRINHRTRVFAWSTARLVVHDVNNASREVRK